MRGSSTRGRLSALAVWLLGCPAPGPVTATETSTSTTETSTSTTESDTESTNSESSTDSETGETSNCGDGIIDELETCDDGNTIGGDGCPPDCVIPPSPCDGQIYSCGDTLDNDGDGLIDLYDPDCTSTCDDTEDAFEQHLAGRDPTCVQDCRWDTDVGAGNDRCSLSLRCDPLSPGSDYGCAYDPMVPEDQCTMAQQPECLDRCLPLAPNGCDCFGCCEIDGVFRHLGHLGMCGSGDVGACPACTPDMGCFNACEPDACELCMLQTPAELARGCAEPSCDPGVEPCTDPYTCGEGMICRTGCCVPVAIL